MKELKNLKELVETIHNLYSSYEDIGLLIEMGYEDEDPEMVKELEEEMLEKINKLGIGPQGFGGKTTAIGLNIETMPTHIAGMPCAVNINCHVTRHKTEVL